MEVALLGPVRVSVDGSPVEISGAGNRAALAMLALAAPRAVSDRHLIAELWGDDLPASAPKMLQNRILRIRKALAAAGEAEPVIVTVSNTYRYALAAGTVDVHRVRELAQRAEVAAARGDPRGAADLLASATAMWSGEPLSDIRDVPFARSAAAELHELRLHLTEERFDAELVCGRHAELIGELRAAVIAEPLRERLWRQLMLALHRSGRQGDALAAYQELRTRLRDELGLDPSSETEQLHRAIATDDLALHSPPPTVVAIVPPAPTTPVLIPFPRPRSRFVGRQRDIVELSGLLETSACVTVVGPAGVGKTRIALEVAGLTEGSYSRGVAFVDLAAVTDPQLVADEVADAVGVPRAVRGREPALPAVLRTLAGHRVLLVLDNCEHVIEAAARVAEALTQALPGLRLIATSREPLRIDGEALWRLAPLAVPTPEQCRDLTELAQVAGARLFLDRAQLRDPHLDLSPSDGPSVGRIVSAVDGLPLALELAAAALDEYDIESLAAALDDRFAVLRSGRRLAPGRQQTLWAAIEWSYRLLTPEEQDVFERLSVLTADAELQTMVEVAGLADADRHAEQLIHSLVQRSLIARTDTRPARYRMLDSIRTFGRQQLVDRLGPEAAYRPLYAWARRAAERAERAVSADDPIQLAVVDDDYPNVREAVRAVIDNRQTCDAAELAIAITPYWVVRGLHAEAHAAFAEVIATLDPSSEESADLLTRALLAHAEIPSDDDDQGEVELLRALEIARRVGNTRQAVGALSMLGNLLIWGAHREDEAERYLTEALALAEQLADPAVTAVVLERFSSLRLHQERHAEEYEFLTRAREVLPRDTHPIKLMWIHSALASNRFFARDLERADAEATAGLVIAQRLGYRYGEAHMLVRTAQIRLANGDISSASEMLSRSAEIAAEIGAHPNRGWELAVSSRTALAAGDLSTATSVLCDPECTRAARDVPNWARRVCVLATASGLLDEAAALLADIDALEGEPLPVDKHLEDDLSWARARLAGTGGHAAADGLDLEGHGRRVLDQVRTQQMLISVPPAMTATTQP